MEGQGCSIVGTGPAIGIYRHHAGKVAAVLGVSKHSVQPPSIGAEVKTELFCNASVIGSDVSGVVNVQIFKVDGKLQHYNQYFKHDLVIYSLMTVAEHWARSTESFMEPLADGKPRFELIPLDLG